jgi:hypothetical protein
MRCTRVPDTNAASPRAVKTRSVSAPLAAAERIVPRRMSTTRSLEPVNTAANGDATRANLTALRPIGTERLRERRHAKTPWRRSS